MIENIVAPPPCEERLAEVSQTSGPPSPHAPGRKASFIVFLLLLAFLLVLNARMVAPYLLTVVMGAILAILFHPVYLWLSKRKLSRKVSASLATLLMVSIVMGPLTLFTLLAVRQGTTLAHDLATDQGLSFETLPARLQRWGPIKAWIGDPVARARQVRAAVQRAGQAATQFLLGLITHVPGQLLDLILASVACWFFLLDGEHFLAWINSKLPLEPEVRLAVAASFKETAVSTVWSALAGAAAQAGCLVVAFAVCGIPAVFVAGGTAFVLAWVPILGSIPVWVAGLIFLVAHGAGWRIALFVGLAGGAGILDNVVRPWVLRGRGDLHSLVALIAIFGGIDSFGMLGVFYGPILMAVLLAVLDAWPLVGRRFGIFFDCRLDLPPSE